MSRFERWSRIKRGLEDTHDNTPEAPLNGSDATAPPIDDAALHESDQAPDGVVADDFIEDDELTNEQADPDARLPDPDTLDPSGDFKAYLAPGVSPELKRRALRHMFTASSYNVRDGLDDYDQDFTQIRDLSREVASTLRHWINEVAEDAEGADDGDTQSIATEVSGEAHDSATSDPSQATAARKSQHGEEHGTPTQSDTNAYDPPRPTNGTV